MADSTARGRLLSNEASEEQHDEHHEGGRSQAGDLTSAARRVGSSGLRQAPGHADPTGEPCRDVGGAGRDELLVGVDPVAVLHGEESSGAETLGQSDHGQRRAADDQGDHLGERQVGHAQPGKTTGDGADHVDALGLQIGHSGDDQPGDDQDETPWHHLAHLGSDEQHDQGHHADGGGESVDLIDVLDDPADLVERAARHTRKAQEGGDLADDDHDRESEHEPADDRFGQELGDPPDPEHPGHQQEHTRDDRQRGDHGQRFGRVGHTPGRDDRSGQDRHGGDRTDHELG